MTIRLCAVLIFGVLASFAQGDTSTVWDLTLDQGNTCRVHRVEMQPRLVGIEWRVTPPDSRYYDIVMSVFPNALASVLADASRTADGKSIARIFVCRKCTLARDEWFAKATAAYLREMKTRAQQTNGETTLEPAPSAGSKASHP